MEQFKDYFKNEKQIVDFFGEEQMFKFNFMSDNTIFFETLNPIFIDAGLYSFEISFYFEEGMDFFCYSSFESFLDQFQISSVEITNEATKAKEKMYFSKYTDNNAHLN